MNIYIYIYIYIYICVLYATTSSNSDSARRSLSSGVCRVCVREREKRERVCMFCVCDCVYVRVRVCARVRVCVVCACLFFLSFVCWLTGALLLCTGGRRRGRTLRPHRSRRSAGFASSDARATTPEWAPTRRRASVVMCEAYNDRRPLAISCIRGVCVCACVLNCMCMRMSMGNGYGCGWCIYKWHGGIGSL